MKKRTIEDWSKNNQGSCVIIGDFKNEYGERYILYCYTELRKLVFITGDELNWEEGFMTNGETVLKEFLLNDNEKNLIKKILISHRI